LRSRVLIVEAVVVIAAFLLGWVYLAGRNGYPIDWDDILYMHTALNTDHQPFILNRYGHIYAQKLFMALNDGDPFRAANMYWALLMAASATLTYLGVRLLTGGQNAISVTSGALAVLFFMSQPYLLISPGVIFADYGVMLMIALASVLYLLAQRFPHFRILLLVSLGLTFFFAIKMKETSLVIGVLFFGLGFGTDGRYNLPYLLKNMRVVLVGMVLGLVIFMMVDSAVLGDALFGLRPENWQALLTFNLREEYFRGGGNFFQTLAGNEALVLSALALLAARLSAGWNTPQKKVLWLLPIAVVGFLTVSLISGAWANFPRYTLIMAPILSVLAACFFHALLSRSSHAMLWLIAALIAGWIFAQEIITPWAVTRYNWDGEDFRRAILMPLALLSAGLIVGAAPSRDRLVLMGCSLCVGLVLMPPAVQVLQDLNTGNTIGQRGEYRWAPYAAFSAVIQPSDDMRLLTSPSLQEVYRYGGRNFQADTWMFNLYFRTRLSQVHFIHEPVTPVMLSQVQPTYVLMTVDDWHTWEDSDQLAVFDEAQVFGENSQRMILINYGTPAPEVQPGVHWFSISAGTRNCRLVSQEAEPGVYEFQCYAPEDESYTILGWTYRAGDGSIGTSVAEGSPVTGDQLKQMAYSFELFSAIESEAS